MSFQHNGEETSEGNEGTKSLEPLIAEEPSVYGRQGCYFPSIKLFTFFFLESQIERSKIISKFQAKRGMKKTWQVIHTVFLFSKNSYFVV